MATRRERTRMDEKLIQLLEWFVVERISILCKRFRGDPEPWTDDDKLKLFHFPNVWREADPGSEFVRGLMASADTASEKVARSAMHRLLGSRISLTQAAMRAGTAGVMSRGGWEKAPYMACSSPKTIDATVARLRETDFDEVDSMGELFTIVVSMNRVGKFMAAQITQDQAMQGGILSDAVDVRSFAAPGMGSSKLLKKIGVGTDSLGISAVYYRLRRDGVEEQVKALAAAAPGLEDAIGRPAELRFYDVENALCEVWRYAYGARLRPRGRARRGRRAEAVIWRERALELEQFVRSLMNDYDGDITEEAVNEYVRGLPIKAKRRA